MPSAIRTTQADIDLVEIGDYIAADNPVAAEDLLLEIDRKCEMLAANPKAGRMRRDLSEGMRSFAVGNYVIFYRPMRDGILVLRVLHGAQDIPELF